MSKNQDIGGKPVGTVGYIRQESPEFTMPGYDGNRYEVLTPDTLDLQERAALAINAMTSSTDPEADYEIYWVGDFYRNPPVLIHNWNDIVQGKFLEALPLLRMVTGSDLSLDVDQAWAEALLRSIGPDGLYYIPTEGRPWARLESGVWWWNPVRRADGSMTTTMDESVTQLGHLWPTGRFMAAMTIFYLRDKNPLWKEAIEAMIGGLTEQLIDKGDYGYYPLGSFEPGTPIVRDAEMPVGGGASFVAWIIQGLAQYFRVSGYGPARTLAGKLVNYLRHHGQFFDTEGRFIERTKGLGAGELQNIVGGHFHSHTICLLAMLDYAMAVGDQELMEFVKKGYDFGRSYGSPLVGFFPESVNLTYPASESCEVAEMIALALKLTEAGVGDFWDDADRWVRNQFVENQMIRTEWVDRLHRPSYPLPVASNETADRVVERCVGGFSGHPSANDLIIGEYAITHCCTGNAARTIYYVWERILDWDNGQLRVNLLLNRASPWADIHSYIPYEGRVDVRIKEACREVVIRVPQWIKSGSDEVTCEVNGEPRRLTWDGRYVGAGEATPGDTVAVKFPISERTVGRRDRIDLRQSGTERIGGELYTLVIKGNTVVFIDPPGVNCPLYQRDHYRNDYVGWRKIERFVSSVRIDW